MKNALGSGLLLLVSTLTLSSSFATADAVSDQAFIDQAVRDKATSQCATIFGPISQGQTTFIAGVEFKELDLLFSSVVGSSEAGGNVYFDDMTIDIWAHAIRGKYEYPVKAKDPLTYCKDSDDGQGLHFQIRWSDKNEKPDISVDGGGYVNLSCYHGQFRSPFSGNELSDMFMCASQGIFASPYEFISHLQKELDKDRDAFCSYMKQQGADFERCSVALDHFIGSGQSESFKHSVNGSYIHP